MLDNLSEKLQRTLQKLKGKGKISEKDIKEAMREVKLSLLEADVNLKVVKTFIQNVSEKSVGEEVMKSLTPAHQVIKIVKDELVTLLGGTSQKLLFNTNSLTVYMMAGLQGAGKTTSAAKLALKLKKQGKKPYLASVDVYRPAAIDQLKVLAKQIDVDFLEIDSKDPLEISKVAVDQAIRMGCNVLILDTAGRLHIDQELMDELKNIKKIVKPTEILLVVDAMVGQESVKVAESFNEQLGIDGVIMTKFDGDTRGGAAFSIKSVTGTPIKFTGVGEKISANNLVEFEPESIASRILGLGDILGAIKMVEENIDQEKSKELLKKVQNQGIDFDDFLDQIRQMKKMGSIKELLSMIPGINKKSLGSFDDREIDKIEAIALSMTKQERRNPDIINASRKQRIANGSGTSVSAVNKVLKEFQTTRKLMKNFTKIGKKGRNPFSNMRLPF